MAFIKALPFFAPFLKELFFFDHDGRSKTCLRAWILGIVMLFGFIVIGKDVYRYWIDREAIIHTLRIQEDKRNKEIAELKKLLDERNMYIKQLDTRHLHLVDRFERLKQEHNHLDRDYRALVSKMSTQMIIEKGLPSTEDDK